MNGWKFLSFLVWLEILSYTYLVVIDSIWMATMYIDTEIFRTEKMCFKEFIAMRNFWNTSDSKWLYVNLKWK